MLAILVALACSGALGQDPRGAMGDERAERGGRGFDLRPLALPALGTWPNAPRLDGARGPSRGVAARPDPAGRPVCVIQILRGDASVDLGIAHPAPRDVDPGIQRSSDCAE
jgi:hypothetical protein